MNGFRRIQYAAERNGTWRVSGKDFAGSVLGVQELISDQCDLLIEVTYCGYTVKIERASCRERV